MNHIRKTIFFIFRYISILFIAFVMVFAFLTIASYDRDINVKKITQLFVYVFKSQNHKYNSEKVTLRFDGKSKVFRVSFANLRFESELTRLDVKSFDLNFNPYNFLLDKPLLSKISASDYNLEIKISASNVNQVYTPKHLRVFFNSYKAFIHNIYKMEIALKAGVIKLIASKGEKEFNVGDLLVSTTPQNLKLKVKVGNSDVSLASNLFDDVITSSLSIEKFSLLDIQEILPDNKYINLLTAGNPHFSLALKNRFNNETEEVDGDIVFDYDNQANKEQLFIRKIKSSIKIIDQGMQLNIKNLDFLFSDDSTVQISSLMKIAELGGLFKKVVIPEDFNFNVKIAGQKIDNIIAYWPDNIAPDVFQWIKTSIIQTKVTKGEGTIKLDKEFFLTGKIKKEAIKAYIDLEASRINYITSHPDVLAANIHIIFDGEKMVASSKNCKIDNGLAIDNVVTNVPYGPEPISLQVSANGDLKDYLFVIPSESTEQIAKEGLKLNQITGKVKTTADIILLKSDVQQLSDLEFVIKAESQQLSLLKNYKLSDMNMKISTKAGDLKIKTLAKIFDMDLDSDYDSSKAFPLEGKLIVSNHSLETLGLSEFLQNHSKGQNIELKFVKKDNYFKFVSDLSAHSLFFKILSYKKESGSNLKLNFSVNNHKDYLQLSDLSLMGEEISLSGFVDIMNNYSRFYFKDAKFGNDALTADITNSKDKNTVILSAKFLDLSKILDSFSFDSKQEKANNFKIKIDKLLLKNNIRASKFEVDLDCDSSYKCSNLNYKTFFEGGFVSEAKKNGRNIEITSTNAELFLKAFGISKEIAGGTMKINLTEPKSAKDNIVGNLEILNFSSVDTSVIVRLILGLSSFASPSTFAGKGILFKSARSEVELSDNKIHIKNGKMRSSAVTVQGDGVIDLKEKNVMFKGKIAPKIYGLNKAIASIPLLGKIASGNSDNVIEATYTVSGNFGDIKTSINPLSILTIGFFKDIFN